MKEKDESIVEITTPPKNVELQIKEKIIEALQERNFLKATEVLVVYLENKYYFKTIRDDNTDEIWVYINGIYSPNGKSYIIEESRFFFGNLYSTSTSNSITAKIMADTFIDKTDFFNQQNEFSELVPLKNGIYNMNTKQLMNFSPQYYFFSKINASYDKSKDCPKIKHFIKSILRNDLDYYTIQEIFGFCLLRDYKYEKGFMLYGEHGRNGKSKLLTLLKSFVGSENCASVSLQEIEKEQFSLINFHNKLVNISSDIPSEAIENTGTYKALTGRDTINANRKNKTHIQFVNYAKMIFACNQLPMVRTFSNAFWIRWVLIDFPYRFLPQHEINSLDDKTNCFLQNTDILYNLMSDDEFSGLFNFALEGLERLSKTNKFSNETSSNDVKIYWLRKSNSVASFIDDVIDIDSNKIMTKQEFRTHYHNYCLRNKLNQMSDKSIKITLSNELGLSEEFLTINNERVWCWRGIKLKDLFSDKTNIIKKYFEEHKEVYARELSELITDDIELFKIIDILEQEGSIMQIRKGVWRVK